MTKGLYLHIPFCVKKCNYCDFYSGNFTFDTRDRYVKKLTQEIEKWGRLNTCPIDTIYIGGGTPSLLSPTQLELILNSVRNNFSVSESPEITCEVNPKDDKDFISKAASLGVNRISIGIQSSNDDELKTLGRRHNYFDAVDTVNFVRKCGISNISGDLMIGLPDSRLFSVESSLKDLISLELTHISAYILKIEENTVFYKNHISIPDDDEVSEQYLHMCNTLEEAGYQHYEISNFAKCGYESRHNNKYWRCEEYIGIGPSAHSFFNGKRFYYPRDIKGFIDSPITIDDGLGGDNEEFIMLALRLKRGLILSEYENKFGHIPYSVIRKAKSLDGFCFVDDNSISLTDKGMLLSNTIITELLEVL